MATSRAFGWLLALVLAGVGQDRALAVVNTSQDASLLPFVACNGRVGFRTSEQQQGGTDLNGDGDETDFVLRVLDLGTGIVTPVAIDASGPLACSGDVFAFGVSEAAHGNVDRNGDFDAFDTVLATWNAATSTLTNKSLAVSAITASSQLFAFTVGESSQGGLDRNGDPDVLDHVLAVMDPATLAVTDLGLEASDAANIDVHGKRVAFLLSEDRQGHNDFNGDGDPVDVVALIYDAATVTLINPNRAVVPALGIQIDSTAAAFVVSELSHGGVSANGDLDASDAVLHVYCFTAGPCATVGLTNVGHDASGGFTLGAQLVAFRTKERSQGGASLNLPDTDTRDFIVQYYRFATGVRTSTGVAGQARIRITGSSLVFGVPERLQNRTNLNGASGDLDLRDVILGIYDTASDTFTSSGHALTSRSCRREASQPVPKGPCMAVGTDLVLFAGGEKEQNRTDLTGDTDYHDVAMQAWRISTAALEPVTTYAGDRKGALVTGSAPTSASHAAFRVAEADQGTVLNGDLDLADRVMVVYNHATSTITSLGQAAEPLFLIENTRVVFRTNETAQNADLNGDGDQNDTVLQYHAF